MMTTRCSKQVGNWPFGRRLLFAPGLMKKEDEVGMGEAEVFFFFFFLRAFFRTKNKFGN